MLTAITAVSAFISIPIGPVPITLQNFVSVLSGVLLGPYLGALSQIIYVILGLFGIPIFAGGTGGIASILHPPFGFLIGFILCPFITGHIIGKKLKPSFMRILIASAVGMLSVYIFGIPYMYLVIRYVSHIKMSMLTTLKTGFIIFIPGDTIKCIIASVLGYRLINLFETRKIN